jgi:hypothetical protein
MADIALFAAGADVDRAVVRTSPILPAVTLCLAEPPITPMLATPKVCKHRVEKLWTSLKFLAGLDWQTFH